jgi:hypothetical protein
MGLGGGEVRCAEKSYAGGRQKPNIETDNDRGCDTVAVFASSHDVIDVVDSAGVEWSSCLIRHAGEQNAAPLVWRSQNKQKSPREKSILQNLAT